MKTEKLTSINEVFRLLGLGTQEEREQFQRLAELAKMGKEPECIIFEVIQTRNNTGEEEGNAKLESNPQRS